MIGLVIALIAVVLATVTGDPTWDAYGTILIGVLLGLISVVLAVEMGSLLVGESARPAQIDQIVDVITGSDHVHALVHLQTQHLGPDELLVAGKVQLDDHLDFDEVVTAIDDVERRLREAVPVARVIYLEPDHATSGPAGRTAAPGDADHAT